MKNGHYGDFAADGSPGAAYRAPGTLSDEEIRRNIEAHLRHGSPNREDLIVEVRAGTVILIGEVPHSVMKHEIEEMAAACPGVRHVENRLTVPLTAPWPDSA